MSAKNTSFITLGAIYDAVYHSDDSKMEEFYFTGSQSLSSLRLKKEVDYQESVFCYNDFFEMLDNLENCYGVLSEQMKIKREEICSKRTFILTIIDKLKRIANENGTIDLSEIYHRLTIVFLREAYSSRFVANSPEVCNLIKLTHEQINRHGFSDKEEIKIIKNKIMKMKLSIYDEFYESIITSEDLCYSFGEYYNDFHKHYSLMSVLKFAENILDKKRFDCLSMATRVLSGLSEYDAIDSYTYFSIIAHLEYVMLNFLDNYNLQKV